MKNNNPVTLAELKAARLRVARKKMQTTNVLSIEAYNRLIVRLDNKILALTKQPDLF